MELKHWKEKETGLTAVFEFADFISAIAFVNKVAERSETHNHHPDILIFQYKKVQLTLFTHSENTITSKDWNLAEEISQIKYFSE